MARLTARETIGSTRAHFQSLNQRSSKGVVYVEEDTGTIKIGNGIDTYNDLPFIVPSDAAGGASGYEFTGGFTDRTTGQSGASDIGTDVEYTADMVFNESFLRFGFDSTRQIANDAPYWGDGPDANEAPHAGTSDYEGIGLFSGAYMPNGVSNMFSFTDNTAYNAASTSGALQYNAATGSYRMDELNVGDLCQFRFDFNITPQEANTTVEVGLIWQTRDASDNATFTFFLATQPLFFGNAAGQTFLNRPTISAYLASSEDVNARALPAIRADRPLYCQPLTTLYTVTR